VHGETSSLVEVGTAFFALSPHCTPWT